MMSQSIQPPNYLANMPNPQQSFVQGLQLGQGVLGIQQEQQSQEQMRQALGQLAANPTTEGIARAMIQFPSLADTGISSDRETPGIAPPVLPAGPA